MTTTTIDVPERIRLLSEGWESARGIAEYYDELFNEVAERIEIAGSVGKGDIAMLTVWKRLRANTPWVTDLLGHWSEKEVRDTTGPAVRAAREGDVIESARKAIDILRPLPGIGRGRALASAVLTAAAPTRLAVYDDRSRKGLGVVGLDLPSTPAKSLYARYMQLVEQCRDEVNTHSNDAWPARNVDLALFMLGKP